MRTLLGMGLVAGLLLLGVAGNKVGAADKEEDIQTRLLALNKVTGDAAILGTIQALQKDADGTKKLLTKAKELVAAKKGEEPLNVNATIILARAAQALKDFETSEQFLRLNVDQATKLESPKKILRAYFALIQVLVENKKTEEADKISKDIVLALNKVSDEDMFETLISIQKDPASAKKLVTAAREMIKAKKKDEPVEASAAIILAQAALTIKDDDSAEALLRASTLAARKAENPKLILRAYSSLVLVLLENKKFEEAEKVFKEFRELDINEEVDQAKDTLRRRMVLILARQGQVDKSLQVIEKILEDDKENGRENPLNQELKAQVLREAGKLDESLALYNKVIDTIQKNRRLPKDLKEQLIDEMNYKLSSVYVDLKQVEKAAALLQKLVDKEPENSTYANDLGFILADHDMKLDDAEKLIRKAIDLDREARKKAFKEKPDLPAELNKDNAAYLDSLGWVLFKKKQYAEAKKYLQEALDQEEGRHLEIYDHLGDCLIKLGEKKEAIETWKKGLENTTENRRDKLRKAEVEKKIKDAEK
jgi:pentatricopeptide repeat protein